MNAPQGTPSFRRKTMNGININNKRTDDLLHNHASKFKRLSITSKQSIPLEDRDLIGPQRVIHNDDSESENAYSMHVDDSFQYQTSQADNDEVQQL